MAKKKPATRSSHSSSRRSGSEQPGASVATPVPASAKEPAAARLEDDADRWSIHLRPLFQRNAEAPVFYAPFVDVRNTPHGIHLLLFDPPAADPDEVVERGGEKRLPVASSAEVILPAAAVEPLILGLAQQYRAFLTRRLHDDAAQAGLGVDGDLQLEWIDHILGLQPTEGEQ